MIVAPSSDRVLNPPFNHPKRVKLLGAYVQALGSIVVVSQRLTWGYALAEDDTGKTHHIFLADLKLDMVTFPAEIQSYRAATERVGYGVWDEVCSLIEPVAQALAEAA